jgi:hypothetical protein
VGSRWAVISNKEKVDEDTERGEADQSQRRPDADVIIPMEVLEDSYVPASSFAARPTYADREELT